MNHAPDPYSRSSAYLVWFLCLFGTLGGHRLYLDKTTSGVIMAIVGVSAWVGLVYWVGIFLMVPLLLFSIVDLARIPDWVDEANQAVRERKR